MGLLSVIPAWFIIVVVLLIIVILILRATNSINVLFFIKKNFFYFFLFLIFALFAISVINIHRTHDIDITSLDGWKMAGKLYLSWMGNFLSNIAKVTGYAINQEWIAPGPGNSTTKP